ncbi:MAG: signal peptidase I [Ruminococcaceae bacterium]|nr:signal peptidase I [Oscillospiraceae bacterium]
MILQRQEADPPPPCPFGERRTHTAMAYQGKRVERGNESWLRRAWKNYGYLVVTVAVVLIIFKVLLQLAYVPSGSMETTIPAKSLLVSWHLPWLVSDPEPERGDVVTFWSEELGKLLVKRVVGLPGDEITFSDGYTYVNGRKLEEPYLLEQGSTSNPRQETYHVPEGCLFMMGDNRGNSMDSRYLAQPYIPISQVQARVLLCISPFAENSWRGVRMIAG